LGLTAQGLLPWGSQLETIGCIADFLSRSTPVRIQLGIKAWSLVSSLVLALVVVAGCNTEESAPATSPGPAAPVTPPPPPTRPETKATPPAATAPPAKEEDKGKEKKDEAKS
jgi:hypothetical protein